MTVVNYEFELPYLETDIDTYFSYLRVTEKLPFGNTFILLYKTTLIFGLSNGGDLSKIINGFNQ